MPRILLIEDDESIITAYNDSLIREGYIVECVANGRDGLQKLDSFKPDLVLLDLFMPIFSGIEFLEELQKMQGHKPKIIVCSNVMDAETSTLVASLGATTSILKAETSIHELYEIIKKTLAT
jgi:DNA-binding response OmpR family regulator